MVTTENNTKGHLLKFVSFRDIVLWDVKRYSHEKIQSIYPIVKLGTYIQEESFRIRLNDFSDTDFGILGINNKEGIFDAYIEKGANINQPYKRMENEWLAYNPYRINVGSIGKKASENKHSYISPAYVVFSCKKDIDPNFLLLLFRTERFGQVIKENTTGSVRQNLTVNILKMLEIPLPPLSIQKTLVDKYNLKNEEALSYEEKVNDAEKDIENFLFNQLAISPAQKTVRSNNITFVRYQNIIEWGVNKINANVQNKSTLYPTVSLQKKKDLLVDIFRGKSPIYDDSTNITILNQKCVKWGEIDVQYARNVDEGWHNRIDKKFATQIGDILINSTGEGTIGRSSIVKEDSKDFLYDSHVLCLRLNNELINPQYWMYLFNSQYVQQQIENLKSAQSTKQTELGVSNVLKIQIPLPDDITIQDNIVKEISLIRSDSIILKENAEKKKIEAIKEFEKAIFKL